MALLDFEGYDNIRNTTAEPGNFNGSSFKTSNIGVFDFGKKAGGDFTGWTHVFPQQLTTFYVNMHVYVNETNVGISLFQFRDGTLNNQLWVGISSENAVSVKRGDYNGTQLGITSNIPSQPIFIQKTWNFVQMRIVVDNSVGAFAMRVNGTEILNVTGVDTQNSATNAYCDALYISMGTIDVYYDNYVLYDETGASFNTWSPETRVRGQKPNANGATNSWTPLSSTNVSNVDEEYDTDTSYNYTDTVDAVDLYAYAAASPTSATIHGVKTGMTFRKDDVGDSTANIIVRSNSTNYEDPAGVRTALATYVYSQWVMDKDPNTSAAWTYSAADALQTGIIRKS